METECLNRYAAPEYIFPYIKLKLNIGMLERALKSIDFRNNILLHLEEKKNKMNSNVRIPEIDRVIFNDPATIILWKSWHMEYDYTTDSLTGITTKLSKKVQDKTIVKCAHGESFNKYNGFCAAVAKYIFESNSNIHRIIKNAQDDSVKKEPKKEPVKEKETKKSSHECKYYRNKYGHSDTCKNRVPLCDGKYDPECPLRKIWDAETKKKKKSGGKAKK